ncbi:MAG: hypothetical protein MZV63_46065 [Marinilabiliales bacterium]|nr:hypothetical protein [Marinilabiliales bacterium]
MCGLPHREFDGKTDPPVPPFCQRGTQSSSSAPSAGGFTGIFPVKTIRARMPSKRTSGSRVTMLGCCREVGRAAFLLYYPEQPGAH